MVRIKISYRCLNKVKRINNKYCKAKIVNGKISKIKKMSHNSNINYKIIIEPVA